MEKKDKVLAPGNSGVNRRRFIVSGCAACAGLIAAPNAVSEAKSGGKMRLRVIYALHAVKQPKPDWPNIGFDFAPVMERTNAALASAFPEIEFIHATATGPVQANNILIKDAFAGIDGYIVVQMNTANLVAPSIVASGKPVLFTRFQYGGTGGFLIFNALSMRSKARNVGFVASSSIDDLVAAVKCFEQVKKGGSPDSFAEAVARVRMQRTPGPGDLSCTPDPVDVVSPEQCLSKARESKILAVGYPGVSLISLPFIPMQTISFDELDAAWKTADRDESRKVAARWQKSAALVEGVSSETLESSAAMYLGMKELLTKHKANAITINCLSGFYGGRMRAYPCMGFHQFCNDGLVGACECDVRSTATMIMAAALTNGRPGYISDPEIDTSKRRIIYAHCVASNRVFGPSGAANPFHILTHSEDRKGASVRSLMPPGYMTTTIEFAQERKQILFHQAKTVDNDPDDRACRTKLVAEPVGDIEKLFTMWDKWGWHRVTVYGDLREPLSALAKAMGYKLVAEA